MTVLSEKRLDDERRTDAAAGKPPTSNRIVATCSKPFFPRLAGMRPENDPDGLVPGVFGFRTLDDTRAMIEYASKVTSEGHNTAVVIGGGLLGLEAARGLQSNHGLDVH